MATEKDRKRAENWTKDEERSLIDAITPFHHEITGKFSNKTTNSRKTAIWSSIATTVGAISGVHRDTTQVKRKWGTLNSSAKATGAEIYRKRNKTGGGKSDDDDESDNDMQVMDLNSTTGKLLKLMGPISVKGIPGGMDSCNAADKEKDKEASTKEISPKEANNSQQGQASIDTRISQFSEPSSSTNQILKSSSADDCTFNGGVSSVITITLPDAVKSSTKSTASNIIPTNLPKKHIAKPIDVPKEMLATQKEILEEQKIQNGHLDRIASALETLISKHC